jgi:hypothetical protein
MPKPPPPKPWVLLDALQDRPQPTEPPKVRIGQAIKVKPKPFAAAQ